MGNGARTGSRDLSTGGDEAYPLFPTHPVFIPNYNA